MDRHHSLRAAILIVVASAFVAGTTILAKSLGQPVLGPPLHPLQVSAGRFASALIALILVLSVLRPKFQSPDWRLHGARSLLGWSGVTCMFAAVALIALPDATAISFLNPVFAMIFAIYFLRETAGIYRWGAACLALVGAFILLRPGMGSFQPAALLALIAAMLLGAELILMKKLSKDEPTLQILTINNLIGCIIACTAASFVWQAPNTHQWFALAGIGCLMLCAQVCYVNALKMADASFVAPFAYTTLIFATLYDFAIFSQVPDIISILGATLIILGAFILAWREGLHKNKR